jgi:hypothetical protein
MKNIKVFQVLFCCLFLILGFGSCVEKYVGKGVVKSKKAFFLFTGDTSRHLYYQENYDVDGNMTSEIITNVNEINRSETDRDTIKFYSILKDSLSIFFKRNDQEISVICAFQKDGERKCVYEGIQLFNSNLDLIENFGEGSIEWNEEYLKIKGIGKVYFDKKTMVDSMKNPVVEIVNNDTINVFAYSYDEKSRLVEEIIDCKFDSYKIRKKYFYDKNDRLEFVGVEKISGGRTPSEFLTDSIRYDYKEKKELIVMKYMTNPLPTLNCTVKKFRNSFLVQEDVYYPLDIDKGVRDGKLYYSIIYEYTFY